MTFSYVIQIYESKKRGADNYYYLFLDPEIAVQKVHIVSWIWMAVPIVGYFVTKAHFVSAYGIQTDQHVGG
jgi:hypothetical protein